MHVAMRSANGYPDYADITSIRQTGLVLLQSQGTQEALDMAVAAHALARRSGKAVVHFFAPAAAGDEVSAEEPALLALGRATTAPTTTTVAATATTTTTASSTDDTEILYADDGVRAQTLQIDEPTASEPTAGAGGPSPTPPSGVTTPPAGAEPPAHGGDSSAPSSAPNSPQASSATSISSADVALTARDVTSADILAHVTAIFAAIAQAAGRRYSVFEYTGPPYAELALTVLGSVTPLLRDVLRRAPSGEYDKVGLLSARLYRPWIGAQLPAALPRSITKIAVLEQLHRQTTRWGPLFLDVLTSMRTTPGMQGAPTIVAHKLGHLGPDTAAQALRGVVQNLRSAAPVQNLVVGLEAGPIAQPAQPGQPQQPSIETAYMKILDQLFGRRLHVANSLDRPNAGVSAGVAASPEYGFGALLARIERRKALVERAEKLARTGDFSQARTAELLSKWLLGGAAAADGGAAGADAEAKSDEAADELVQQLEADGSAVARRLLAAAGDGGVLFRRESAWLVGSDAWAYDLGNSGVHHVLAAGENVNMLIIDSTPYSQRAAGDAARRKKDIGLYAMNFGSAYVASVAVYSSYTQVLHAMLEADRFVGPSVVLAYLPYSREDDSALAVLQETKKAVDIGYWPLYRYDPFGDERQEAEGLDGEEQGQQGEQDHQQRRQDRQKELEEQKKQRKQVKAFGGNFTLESERIKKELQEFLARENHLTQLVRRHPAFAANLAHSYGSEVRQQQKRNAKAAFAKLVDGLSGPPLTILFASDGGNAEGLARRLGRRGKARGLKALVMSLEDYPVEDLASEENVVVVASTAGQGEFPMNGRGFWEAVRSSTDLDLAGVRFGVFGLGDSHYWPRKADRGYYNKPAKDLDRRLRELGAQSLVAVGLGDDQDPDGFQTGYGAWEPQLWQALGVDRPRAGAGLGLGLGLGADADAAAGADEDAEPPPVTNEDIKLASNYLRGTIAEGLADASTGALSASDGQLTKFHGTYQQDDRDLRDERRAQGLEPAYSFMIRCRLAGGVASPQQWLQMDAISDAFGNHTMKLTTRQTFQFHGVVKRDLRRTMRAINRALMTTLAACGDVNRNVMCSSLPAQPALHAQALAVARRISDHLLPATSAYHEIWLQDQQGDDDQSPNGSGGGGGGDGKDAAEKKVLVAGGAVVDHEPLYGPVYLPRKFKITIAVPPHNDTDVYAHDVGLIAICDADGQLAGFNVLVGGGMGVTHSNTRTYPRTGSLLGFAPADSAHLVCEKVMLVQRDHGDRRDRKHARLKYTVDDMGVGAFRAKVEALLGWPLTEPRPFRFASNTDVFGWQRDDRSLNHFTFFIENGRVEDTPDFPMKSGLRDLAKMADLFGGEFRLTANQHLILSNVPDAHLPAVKALMAARGLDNHAFSGLRLSSSACVAFPTCGLAMAESERYLPSLISKVEDVLEQHGLRHDSIVMRMTGCPNGCARPWLAEIAFVGKAYGAYNMYLGGGHHGERLNKLYRSSIHEPEILEIVRPLFKRYALEREPDEPFGDFCIRVGLIKATTEGKTFHDDVSPPHPFSSLSFPFFSFPFLSISFALGGC